MKTKHFMGSLVKLAVHTLCLDMVECCFGLSALSALPLYVDTHFIVFTPCLVFFFCCAIFNFLLACVRCNSTNRCRYCNFW